MVAVGNDDQVYVIWEDTNNLDIYIQWSCDAGATWQANAHSVGVNSLKQRFHPQNAHMWPMLAFDEFSDVLGAVYLRSDLHRLTAAIGMGRTKALIYSAEAIDADEALRIGLIDRTVANEAFEAELDRFVERVLSGSPFTLRQTKAMLRGVGSGQTPAETPETLAAFVAATQGEDFREGVAAFLAKRQPVFR
jgi:hypothetical protein